MSQIFVAYSEQDEAMVRGIRAHLESRHYSVSDGTDPETSMADSLACVFVASEDSVKPGPARDHAESAASLGVPLILVQRKQMDGLKDLLPWLHDAHVINMGRVGTMQSNLTRRLKDIANTAQRDAAGDTETDRTNGITMVDETVDITQREDLIRYVVRTQLYRSRASDEDLEAAGVDPDELRAFRAGEEMLSAEAIRHLNEAVIAIGRRNGVPYVGGIAQYAARMRDPVGDASSLLGNAPDWSTEALQADSDNEIHVLIQASALMNEFRAAEWVRVPAAAVRAYHERALVQIVRRLVLLASGLQTPRYLEAQLMLVGLSKYAFQIVHTELSNGISSSPLGFRTWRSVSRLVTVAQRLEKEGEHDQHLIDQVKVWLLDLVAAAPALRGKSVYPGRALDLECFVTIPWSWGMVGGRDIVTEVLLMRAHDEKVTLRERGTAAMGLWRRAWDNKQTEEPQVRGYLDTLIEKLEQGNIAPDLESGLRWVVTTLKSAMRDNLPVCVKLPEVDEVWYQQVQRECANLCLGMPTEIVRDTQELFKHALLQNAGVERRRAIDALRAGGLINEVTSKMFELLQGDKRTVVWLRVRVLLALGFMRPRDWNGQRKLTQAFREAAVTVLNGNASRAEITELQEAAFALADVFGVTGIEELETIKLAGEVRDILRIELESLVKQNAMLEHGRNSIARAIAYLLTFTAQSGENDLSRELLTELADHPDDVAADLSKWALEFRWGPQFEIRPLLQACKNVRARGLS